VRYFFQDFPSRKQDILGQTWEQFGLKTSLIFIFASSIPVLWKMAIFNAEGMSHNYYLAAHGLKSL